MDRKSVTIGRAAIRMAISDSRECEQQIKQELAEEGIRSVAIDFGGKFIQTIPKIIEHAVVAAQRQNVIDESHTGEGAIIGAVQECLEQLKRKAIGFNVGGKIGIARYKEHLSAAIYMGVGIMHLNEITIAIAHRSLPDDHYEIK